MVAVADILVAVVVDLMVALQVLAERKLAAVPVALHVVVVLWLLKQVQQVLLVLVAKVEI
ncbi:MAG: hypothetical protein IPJ60_09915 [Sphingobacteriaceae bacterium]|nr:hypothetical protein [Sphingobacteriaceae bacterium]